MATTSKRRQLDELAEQLRDRFDIHIQIIGPTKRGPAWEYELLLEGQPLQLLGYLGTPSLTYHHQTAHAFLVGMIEGRGM